jgi:hypothetical protein
MVKGIFGGRQVNVLIHPFLYPDPLVTERS